MIKKLIQEEIYECNRKIAQLMYFRGNYRKGLEEKDKRFAHRARLMLLQIAIDCAEGKYISKKELNNRR